MKHSTRRILTSHVGSLIRPQALQAQLRAKAAGSGYDAQAHADCLRESVAEVVREQARVGIDVVSDGEYGKSISWSQYALERLSGFERRRLPEAAADPFARGADRARFPEFYAELDEIDARPAGGAGGRLKFDSVCVGPIRYTGQAALARDVDNFKAALGNVKVEEAFMPVAAPASVIPDRRNEYYKTDEELVVAIAEAMRVEYRTIVDAGFLLQIDDARAAVSFDRMVPPKSLAGYRKWLGLHQDLLNHALDGIPEDRVRYHVCWGSWPGPHTTDVPIKDIADLILKVRAGAYALEMANPRHEHEWRLWERVKLPPGRLILPGVISHATNIVEHPELVAERIVRLAKLVGRENVIASTEGGFALGPFHPGVHPAILGATRAGRGAGAKRATRALWGASSRGGPAKRKTARRKTVRRAAARR